jgi:hypothetical protein
MMIEPAFCPQSALLLLSIACSVPASGVLLLLLLLGTALATKLFISDCTGCMCHIRITGCCPA